MDQFWHALSTNKKAYIWHFWDFHARRDQRFPKSDDWLLWLLMGGRGCGKTRTGAEWVRYQARRTGRIALIAPTLNDAREVMLEGESGLLNIGLPAERPHYTASRRLLEWPSGAVGYLFSSEDPDSLRGPQFGAAWADEFCAWQYPDETLSNLRLGLRLGDTPRLTLTTTPRATPAMIKLAATKGIVVHHATTQDNSLHLPPIFLSAMKETYGQTRLGRQELDGELLTEQEGALWSYAVLEAALHLAPIPKLDKIVVSVDPPVTSGLRSDQCGLIVAGRAGEAGTSRAYILQDATEQGLSPEAWARKAINLYHQWDADCLLVETNQGGDLVTTLIHTLDPSVPIRTAFAKKSKVTRAEPVAMLYEQGRVLHTRQFKDLETELSQFGTKNLKHSPDRADALIWAVTHLLLNQNSGPHIRRL